MKKLLYVAILLLGVGIMAVSCQKDSGASKKDYADLIVGKWNLTKMDILQSDGESISYPVDGDVFYVYVFHDNGKVDIVSKDARSSDSYTVSGNTLTIGKGSSEIEKLSLTEMVLNQKTTILEMDFSMKSYFKRVK